MAVCSFEGAPFLWLKGGTERHLPLWGFPRRLFFSGGLNMVQNLTILFLVYCWARLPAFFVATTLRGNCHEDFSGGSLISSFLEL